jgi:DnaJ family protein C protein 3
LEIDPENVNALYHRGEAKISNEDYAEALKDFETAHNLNKEDRRIVDAYHRAQRLQRAAGRKDYYKILGVPRTATQREIKKAYQKLAREWHPDKYKGDLPKEKVAQKMSEINEAYQTLSDEEKRAMVDNGEDPNVSFFDLDVVV